MPGTVDSAGSGPLLVSAADLRRRLVEMRRTSPFAYAWAPELEAGAGTRARPAQIRAQLLGLASGGGVGAPHPILVPLGGALAEELVRGLRRFGGLVAWNWKPLLFSFLNLGLGVEGLPVIDLGVAAAAAQLGLFHERNFGLGGAARKRADESRRRALDPAGLCAAAGVPGPRLLDGDTMGWLGSRRAEPPPGLRATLESQRQKMALVHQHLRERYPWVWPPLERVEFPFVVANAVTEYGGVGIYVRGFAAFVKSMYSDRIEFERRLRHRGLDPNDDDAIRARLRASHTITSEYIDDELLEDLATLGDGFAHDLLRFRQAGRWANNDWLADAQSGRLFPRHHQLRAQTGRNTCVDPPLTTLHRQYRKMIRARRGCHLVAIDYNAIDIWVLAELSNDSKLRYDLKSGDIYVKVAKRLFADSLTRADFELSDDVFAYRHQEMRNRVKEVFLALLYNMGDFRLATKLDVDIVRARRLKQQLLDLYPYAVAALANFVRVGRAKGYAEIAGGLRRHIHPNAPSHWVDNFLRNTPVQGAGAVVFKRAVVRLQKMVNDLGAKIVLPLHDGVLVESPVAFSEEVRNLGIRCFEKGFADVFPGKWIRVKAEVLGPTWEQKR